MKQVVKKSQFQGDVVGRDKVTTNNPINAKFSNNEKRILKLLYILHSENKYPRINIPEAFNKLNIKEGTFVGDLNDSKVVKIEGSDFIITAEGIRYIESLDKNELQKIVLPEEQREMDLKREKHRQQIEAYRQKTNSENRNIFYPYE